ncbi:Aldo/keto reductase [Fomitiporia mediterranea MF3/22]|uniref:Aldo/keto reductase n=1 Tax=Fomitiporia mediterranea (strain MF3/22) TaxID=694068 RepID=UPI0004408EA2|nr:Aldo/keto reductase [Fomitiporia mediterranea MF3/22]EJD07794.1 Aldo/keto reductase [Fomitiporia mediterranea MF3/22]
MPILGLGVFENDDCYPACCTALKHGYRHIDTAEYYHNEVEVGRVVRESGIPRENIFVTTKIYHPEHGYDSTLAHVEESLAKFQSSYIDLYLIHSALSGTEKRLQTYRALLEKRNAGKIETVGVSNYGIHHLEEIRLAELETPAVNQIELHPFCQQKPIVEYCHAREIVIQAYCPLIRGDFSHPVIQEVSQSTGRTPAQVLIRWSLQHGFVPLPKSANPDRVISNANIFDFSLSDEDMAKLDRLDKGRDGCITWNPVDCL